MKTATKELIDLLHGSDEFQMADLYTITLSGGQVLRPARICPSFGMGRHTSRIS